MTEMLAKGARALLARLLSGRKARHGGASGSVTPRVTPQRTDALAFRRATAAGAKRRAPTSFIRSSPD